MAPGWFRCTDCGGTGKMKTKKTTIVRRLPAGFVGKAVRVHDDGRMVDLEAVEQQRWADGTLIRVGDIITVPTEALTKVSE